MIKWGAEVTFIVSVCLLSICLFLLQQFVQEYAFNLIDRQNHVSRLSKQNADLQVQLRAMKKDIDLDLDSPITKVIKAIRNIQDKCDLDVDVMESLDYVIQLLSSNQLFMPNLNVNKDAIDSDVKNWLNAMITNHSEVANQADKSMSAATPQSVPDAQIQELLKTIDGWDFRLFDLVELSNGRPLYFLAWEVFERLNLKSQFNLEDGNIQTFLTKIEDGYREVFASVVASIIHDLDHPGVNNAYLINSSSSLAIRYNDQSVMILCFHAKKLKGVGKSSLCTCLRDDEYRRKLQYTKLLVA
ncbi:High affinity cAMP-specific 3',5'-cyclic phosphodiesterase 7A [Phlyctochytrium bullatum]|nr:High affinity cAMP-specific 3',5'-cyclic phosphodiesterase 7A [Phlyctochytrium bullatum]